MEGDIKKICIIGAGTMGHGLAQSFAQGGYQVNLVDVGEEYLDRASTLIKSSLNTMAEEGILAKSQIQEILDRISFTTSLEEGGREADIAIEAVVEDKEIKKED